MANPVFRAAGAVALSPSTITPGAPAGLTADDVELLIVQTANEAATLSTAAGFALLTTSAGQGTAGASGSTRMTVFWRRWNGTDGDPTVADSGDHTFGQRFAFSGCRTAGDPWDVFGSNVQAATTSGSASGVTTTVADCMICICVGQGGPDANSTVEFSGWTNSGLATPSIAEAGDRAGNFGVGGALGFAYGGLASAGASGATTYTSATSAAKDNVVVALTATSDGLGIPIASYHYRHHL